MNAYNITAPEEIAKKYGGNKKKIQQAAAQGLINPTEAVMAGMFIDRMRNAAAQEQAQQPTVAEQVMNPQPQMPPQAMAAAPQARQMPPQAQMGQPSPQAMMAARGGMLTIPYNEGDYAEGGIVSFAVGGGYGETMAQLRRQLGAARTQAQRDQIQAAMNQLRAQYEKPSLQPNMSRGPQREGLAAVDTSDPMAIGMESFDDNNPVQSQRIDPNRFSTGTYQGEETKYMGKGDEVLGNVRRGLGLFTDFVKSKLPSFDFGDSEEFSRLKNAQEVVDPAEQARRDRVALAMQTRGEGQNVFPVDNSDPFAVGMETFTDGQRATTPTEQTAPMRSQQIPTSLGPQVGRGQDPRLFGEGEGRRQALAALAARNPNLIDPADGMKPEIRQMTREEVRAAGLPLIDATRSKGQEVSDAERFLSNEGFSVARQVAEQTPAVADQVKQTEQAVTQPAPEPKPENESKPADTTMDITEQFKVFDKELAGLMEKPEHGKYRKEMENLLGNREKRLKEAKKEGFNMALLQAGLGMLAQGGGQTALQALGKAALPATKQYAAAVKDAKKEDRELLKLGLSMEQMDAKELAATKRTLATIYGSRANAMLQAAVSEANSIRGAESRERVAEITSKAQQGLSSAIRGSTAMTSIENQLGDVRKESAEIRARVEFDYNADLLAARDALRNNPNDPAARQALADIQLVIDREIAAAEQKAGITDARNRLIAERNNLAKITGSGSGNAIDYSSLVPK